MPVAHLTENTTSAAVAEALASEGAVIVDRLAPIALMDCIAEELAPYMAATPTGPVDDHPGAIPSQRPPDPGPDGAGVSGQQQQQQQGRGVRC